jgi:hypothetical protein
VNDSSITTLTFPAFIRKPFPATAQKLLDSIKPLLEKFLSDATPVPHWESNPKPTDPALLAHMESLELLDLNLVPLVILKDLGRMDDPDLSSRVEKLFKRGKTTRVFGSLLIVH